MSGSEALAIARAPDPTDVSFDHVELELYSPSEGMVSMALPAAGWTVGGDGTLKFRDSGGAPVRVAVVRRGRSLKLTARSVGYSLANPLVGVGIRLVSGTLATCSFFPASSVVRTEPGRFEARGGAPSRKHATASRLPAACRGEPNPGLPPDDPIDPGGGFCTAHLICPILPLEQ